MAIGPYIPNFKFWEGSRGQKKDDRERDKTEEDGEERGNEVRRVAI